MFFIGEFRVYGGRREGWVHADLISLRVEAMEEHAAEAFCLLS